MCDPLVPACYARSKLTSDGWVILIEPSASDHIKDNMNPIGQMCFTFSTMGCVPTAKSQKVGLVLGAQAGAKTLIELMNDARFSDCSVVFKNVTTVVIACKA